MTNQNLKLKKAKIRYLDDMRGVLYDKKWAKNAPNLELYYIYRGLKQKGELRYDITLIPSKMLGEEFVKTKGNRNSKNFQELYVILGGEAIFLMQKTKRGRINIIEDVVFARAKKGECIIFPPRYATVVINPSEKTLKIANWVSEKNKNIYKELEVMKGAGYFYTKNGWIRNKNYKKVPELRFEKPLKKIPKNLDFLKE